MGRTGTCPGDLVRADDDFEVPFAAFSVGGHQDLPTGDQQRLPVHGQLVTQRDDRREQSCAPSRRYGAKEAAGLIGRRVRR